MSKPADRIPELIRDWSEIVSDALTEQGVAGERADELGMMIVRRICDAYAGQQFYLPIWTAQRISERDRAIADAAAAGQDIDALASKHQLHATTIYAIIRRVGAAELTSRQARMFEDSEPPSPPAG